MARAGGTREGRSFFWGETRTRQGGREGILLGDKNKAGQEGGLSRDKNKIIVSRGGLSARAAFG